MEMAQVRYFLAVCVEGNFTRAARACGVAQPSLTKAIKALENEVGGQLFQRRTSGAPLTDLGIVVEPYFSAIMRNTEIIKRFRKVGSAFEGVVIHHSNGGRDGTADKSMAPRLSAGISP